MIQVNGTSQLKRHLLSLVPKVKQGMRAITLETAQDMEQEAQARAPVDTGMLRASIRFEINNGGLGFVLLADAPYWPYVEFGTGGLVDIPPGYDKLAARFKGKGKRTVNLPARPFLIPAYVIHSDIYLNRIRQMLPRLLR